MKAGFVNIFGKPNAGKSTLLNALIGEKLAIVSSKVQTTRHRIKGIRSNKDYQIVFSDTPGIIEPRYKLHEKMMAAVKGSLEDADLAILLFDARDNREEADAIFSSFRLKVPALVVINKSDLVKGEALESVMTFFRGKPYCRECLSISALQGTGVEELVNRILVYLPDGEPFYPEDELSDLNTRFFAGELIREKIYDLYAEEIPYQSTVLVTEFKEKLSLIKITAEIIVHRETQKVILLGKGGAMIKKLGTEARQSLEEFLGQKVFLELFVKVRPKWRDNDLYLREYGYGG